MTSIEPFIHRKILVLSETTTARQAARAMCENRVGCVVVSGQKGQQTGHIVGIVTDRDLVCALLAYSSDVQTPLSEIMTTDLITVSENADLKEVIDLMASNGVRRIPIVRSTERDKQKCIGLITLDDLIAARSVDYVRLSEIVRSQIVRRSQKNANGVRGRSQAHIEQTLNRFIRCLAENMQLGEERAEEVARLVLSLIVRRLHYTGAAHLISQLPHLMQDELLDLPAGPDRSITYPRILEEIETRLGVDEFVARNLLTDFSRAISGLLSPSDLEHVKVQLPSDLRSMFTSRESEELLRFGAS